MRLKSAEATGQDSLAKRDGRLGVLIPGLGAVATTWIAGVHAIRKGLGAPVGSLTQMGFLEEDGPSFGARRIRESLPLAAIGELVFGGWDLFPEDAFDAAMNASVLDARLLQELEPELRSIRPMPGVYDPLFLPKLQGTHIKPLSWSKRQKVEALRQEMRSFFIEQRCDRGVMVWCASTERYAGGTEIHRDLESFERALDENRPEISPSQLYAYAALMERVPYVNGSPNVSLELRCFRELAERQGVPVAGSDFKTGQTLLKTAIAPALRSRHLGVRGWFSTNILGNRDGEALDDPEAFRSKEVTKSGVLAEIFSPHQQPELYGQLSHLVRIHYYPPRGDNKEGWDNIDLFGWLGYPMQLKINFLCRDSILAAPVALDLALLMDLASRMGQKGPQDWLSFFFKAPLGRLSDAPTHDLAIQYRNLQEQLNEWSTSRAWSAQADARVTA